MIVKTSGTDLPLPTGASKPRSKCRSWATFGTEHGDMDFRCEQESGHTGDHNATTEYRDWVWHIGGDQ